MPVVHTIFVMGSLGYFMEYDHISESALSTPTVLPIPTFLQATGHWPPHAHLPLCGHMPQSLRLPGVAANTR